MLRRRLKDEHRTVEQLREHYEVERELADKLRNASRQERRHLYSSMYDELSRRVPHHPQLTRKLSPESSAKYVSWQMGFLKRFLDKKATFLEVGPGDCALAFEVTKHVSKVYGVEVAEEITKQPMAPPNFQLLLSDGSSIPLPPSSVDIAYSNQLMEHVHPEDAIEQLQNIYSALVPGGIYVCVTPNRLRGPSDISMYFDTVATGFHLKEYSVRELSDLFVATGFSKVMAYIGGKGIYAGFPILPIRWLETVLEILPNRWGYSLARSLPIRSLLGIRLVGVK